MARRVVAASVFGVLAACRAASPAPIELVPHPSGESPDRTWESPLIRRGALERMASAEGARCPIHAVVALDAQIDAGPRDDHALAYSLGHSFEVDVRGIAPRGSSKILVRVRAVERKPELSVEGWIEPWTLPLRLARDVVIARGHVWLARGAPVRVVAGNANRVRIAPDTDCYADFGLGAETDCSALELVPAHAPPGPYDERRAPHHPRYRSVSLRDEAGRVISELGYGTLDVTERRGALAHVSRRDDIRIDGWMRSSDLEPGEEPDVSDCEDGILDVDDRCPGDSDAGCPDVELPARVLAHDVSLRQGPSLDAKVIGVAEHGLRVRVQPKSDGFVMLYPESALRPPNGQWGFWALATDVQVRSD